MTFTQSCPELYGMRVVKYIRCSHDDQVLHGDTLNAQNEILDNFIQKNHLTLVDTFVDEALTAQKKYTKRKEFVRLLDGVQRRDLKLDDAKLVIIDEEWKPFALDMFDHFEATNSKRGTPLLYLHNLCVSHQAQAIFTPSF